MGSQRWYRANRKTVLERAKRRYHANKTMFSQRHKVYYELHKEEIKAKVQKWRHSPEGKLKVIENRHKHAKASAEASKRWYFKHRDEIREKQKIETQNLRAKVLCLLGMKCRECGALDSRVLQIDHINGCPVKSVNRTKFAECGDRFYVAVLRGERDLKNYQLLCANCNLIKKIMNSEVGHYKQFRKGNQ